MSARSRKIGVEELCHQIERIVGSRPQRLRAVRITAPADDAPATLREQLGMALTQLGLFDVEVLVTEAPGPARLVATEFER